MKNIALFIRQECILLFLLLVFLLDPFSKGILVLYLLIIYFFTKLHFLHYNLDGKGFLLFLFSILYALFYYNNPVGGQQMTIFYAFAPFTFYIIGRYFSITYRSESILYFLFLFLAIAYSVLPAISILKHIIENGFGSNRNLTLIWDNSQEFSATIIAAHFTLNMSSLGIIFAHQPSTFESKIKIIMLTAFFISLFCIFRVASITQLLVTTLTFILAVVYLISYLPGFRKINLLLMIAVAVFAFILIYSLISDSALFNTFHERNSDRQYVLSGSGRTTLWLLSIGNVFSRPSGWSDSEMVGYAHNLWLDVSRVAGILPFLTIILFTTICISMVYHIVINTPENHFFNTTILTYFGGFMIVFFVEPIMEGFFTFFLIFCVFIGILSGYDDNRKFKCKRSLLKFPGGRINP